MLLANVSEDFIYVYTEYYGLTLCHYFGSTGLSWNAVLKMTWNWDLFQTLACSLKKTWEELFPILLRDIRKPIINRWKCMMIISQVNMLHIWTQKICIAGQWVNILLIVDLINVNLIRKNSWHGYVLEVDLEYPKIFHNSYPLTSEKSENNFNMLSQYCSNIADQYDIVVSADKLVINLGKKNKYVLQYKRFQLHLLLGMR